MLTRQLDDLHAGVVPLDLLKEGEDRIARRLAHLDARIEAGHTEDDQAGPLALVDRYMIRWAFAGAG